MLATKGLRSATSCAAKVACAIARNIPPASIFLFFPPGRPPARHSVRVLAPRPPPLRQIYSLLLTAWATKISIINEQLQAVWSHQQLTHQHGEV